MKMIFKKRLNNYLSESVINTAFVIQALDQFSKSVIESKEELLQKQNLIVDANAWLKSAEDLRKVIDL